MFKRGLPLIIFTITLLILSGAQAQVIVLSCEIPLTKEYTEKLAREAADDIEENCRDKSNYCDMAQDKKDRVKACLKSKVTYSEKREFIFDKKSLTDKMESWAEVVEYSCVNPSFEMKSFAKINATPTIISFDIGGWESKFEVYRETLKGGWQKQWQCDVKEKILKNKI